MKVLIFYSSLGGGHLSGGKLYIKNLEKIHPNLKYQFIDVRSFMSSVHEKLDRKIFWSIVKNFPNLYTKLFKKKCSWFKNNSIENWNEDYSLEKIEKAISDYKPDLIVSTHYGAAISLVLLKKKKRILNCNHFWLHTDFFEEFLPEISKHVDHTYLMHPSMLARWINAGIDEKKVSTFSVEDELESTLRNVALEKNGYFQVLVTAGLEGVGPILQMTKVMLKQSLIPLNITIICGNNESLYNQISQLKQKENRHQLDVRKYVPHLEHLRLMKSSHVILTKAGGVSTFEILNLKKPLLLMKAYGGHEFLNADFLESERVATIINENNINDVLSKIAFNQHFKAEKILLPSKVESKTLDFSSMFGRV